MIEKIILLPAEQGYTDTTTLAGKLTLIIRKINEIVDQINVLTKAATYPPYSRERKREEPYQ